MVIYTGTVIYSKSQSEYSCQVSACDPYAGVRLTSHNTHSTHSTSLTNLSSPRSFCLCSCPRLFLSTPPPTHSLSCFRFYPLLPSVLSPRFCLPMSPLLPLSTLPAPQTPQWPTEKNLSTWSVGILNTPVRTRRPRVHLRFY